MTFKTAKRILVIMSTYNGEMYLSEQIQSILDQVGVDLTLAIRDDGSEDNTAKIIRDFSEKDTRVIPIYGNNVGFRKSFFNTLREYSDYDYDYYAFSDQDDVWLPEKLAIAVDRLDKIDKPIKMYTSSLNVVDQNLNPMYLNSFSKLKISYGSALSRQRLAGCTMVFDKPLARLCQKYDMDKFQKDIISHDGAVYYICLACGGKIVYDNKSYIQFRRHNNTVTEHGKGFIKRLESIIAVFGNEKNIRLKRAESIYFTYENEMPREIKEFSQKIVGYNSNLQSKLNLAFDKRIKCNVAVLDMVYWFAILAGCY